jgi:metal-dependent HD superfamily phosphatase/phosphodiesterase
MAEIFTYSPGTVPRFQNNDQIATFLYDELQKIKSAFDCAIAKHVDEWHAVPERVENGMVVIADGTDWNPGSGRGVYWYDGDAATWKLLG